MKSRRRKFFIGAATAVLVAAVLVLSANTLLEKYLKNKLQPREVLLSTGYFSFGYDDLSVSLFTRSCRFTGLSLKYRKMQDTQLHADLYCPAVKITGINIYGLLKRKELDINELNWTAPRIEIRNLSFDSADSSGSAAIRLYDLLAPVFQSLEVRTLSVKDSWIRVSAKDSMEFSMQASADLDINGILTKKNSNRFVDFEGFSLSIAGLTTLFEQGLYSVSIPHFEYHTADSLVKLDSIRLSPMVDKKEFAIRTGRQMDCMDISISGLNIFCPSLYESWINKSVVIDSLVIGNVKFQGYRDKNVVAYPVERVLHHTFFASIPFDFHIALARLLECELVYEELAPGLKTPGVIRFSEVTATASNISNTAWKDTLMVSGTGKMHGEAAFRVALTMPLAKDEFFADVTMGPYSLSHWNSMLRNLAPYRVKSGTSSSTSFSMHAGAESGTGSLTFLYSDLKMESLKRVRTSNEKAGEALEEFVVNEIFLKDENPERNSLRIGQIAYQRNPEKSFINYFWKLAFSGVLSSVGLEKEKLKVDLRKL